MRKNVIFTIVFAAVIAGLVQLHSYSQKEMADAVSELTITSIDGIADISYPSAVEERNDIPFVKLIDPEVRKSIPDSVDVEIYRPGKIFLAKGFNADDPAQLKNFSNIVISGNVIDGFNSENLTDEAVTQISTSVKASVEQNAAQSSFLISDWTDKPAEEINGTKVLRYEYKQINSADRITCMALTYLFKGNKQVEVLMSAQEKEYAEWAAINDKIVSGIVIK